MIHELKCWSSVYDDVKQGLKPWEYRKNDRDFQVDDVLRIREWVPGPGVIASAHGAYTGREIEKRVSYVMHGGRFGIPAGYCIMTVTDE